MGHSKIHHCKNKMKNKHINSISDNSIKT